jgi:hypothetical protein
MPAISTGTGRVASLVGKGWAGRVCQYSRQFREVKPRRVHADGTGYVRGLYTIPHNDDPRVTEYSEREFLKVTGDGAARMASQAVRYIWGVDDSQLRFVENRLGKMLPSTPLDTAPLSSKARGS